MVMQINTKTYGIIPKNPTAEVPKIEDIISVGSFKAVGENNLKTPILHIKISNKYGIILKVIEGILVKYF
jgi:hypothetical protein